MHPGDGDRELVVVPAHDLQVRVVLVLGVVERDADCHDAVLLEPRDCEPPFGHVLLVRDVQLASSPELLKDQQLGRRPAGRPVVPGVVVTVVNGDVGHQDVQAFGFSRDGDLRGGGLGRTVQDACAPRERHDDHQSDRRGEGASGAHHTRDNAAHHPLPTKCV